MNPIFRRYLAGFLTACLLLDPMTIRAIIHPSTQLTARPARTTISTEFLQTQALAAHLLSIPARARGFTKSLRDLTTYRRLFKNLIGEGPFPRPGVSPRRWATQRGNFNIRKGEVPDGPLQNYQGDLIGYQTVGSLTLTQVISDLVVRREVVLPEEIAVFEVRDKDHITPVTDLNRQFQSGTDLLIADVSSLKGYQSLRTLEIPFDPPGQRAELRQAVWLVLVDQHGIPKTLTPDKRFKTVHRILQQHDESLARHLTSVQDMIGAKILTPMGKVDQLPLTRSEKELLSVAFDGQLLYSEVQLRDFKTRAILWADAFQRIAKRTVKEGQFRSSFVRVWIKHTFVPSFLGTDVYNRLTADAFYLMTGHRRAIEELSAQQLTMLMFADELYGILRRRQKKGQTLDDQQIFGELKPLLNIPRHNYNTSDHLGSLDWLKGQSSVRKEEPKTTPKALGLQLADDASLLGMIQRAKEIVGLPAERAAGQPEHVESHAVARNGWQAFWYRGGIFVEERRGHAPRARQIQTLNPERVGEVIANTDPYNPFTLVPWLNEGENAKAIARSDLKYFEEAEDIVSAGRAALWRYFLTFSITAILAAASAVFLHLQAEKLWEAAQISHSAHDWLMRLAFALSIYTALAVYVAISTWVVRAIDLQEDAKDLQQTRHYRALARAARTAA